MNALQSRLAVLFASSMHDDGYTSDSVEGLRVSIGRWLDNVVSDSASAEETDDTIRDAILDAIVG